MYEEEKQDLRSMIAEVRKELHEYHADLLELRSRIDAAWGGAYVLMAVATLAFGFGAWAWDHIRFSLR